MAGESFFEQPLRDLLPVGAQFAVEFIDEPGTFEGFFDPASLFTLFQ